MSIYFRPRAYQCPFETSVPDYRCVLWDSKQLEWNLHLCSHELTNDSLHKCTCDKAGDIALMYFVDYIDLYWIAYLIGVCGSSLSILCQLATVILLIRKSVLVLSKLNEAKLLLGFHSFRKYFSFQKREEKQK